MESVHNLNGKKRYDIFLAHDIDNENEMRENIPFYDQIESVCTKLGHNLFVPYRFVMAGSGANRSSQNDIDVLLNNIMIPQSNLVICHLTNSTSLGMMDERAKLVEKPIIYFYQEKAISQIPMSTFAYGNIQAMITFKTQEECLGKLENQIDKYFLKPWLN